MRKVLVLSLAVIALAFESAGQDYHSLLVEGNIWNVLSAGLMPPWPPDTVYQTETYKVSGDTVINSVSYKKLYSSMEEFPVTWYLFRIPVRQFDEKVGDINGFKSIRYARLYLTGFTQPVVIRMAKFRAVGNKWRRIIIH